MKTEITNPFVTGGYLGPEYFCNRTEETKRLLDAISSKRNLTLISLRRMGKTGLLKHVKYQLEHLKKPFAVVYIDLLPTMNGNEMLNALSSALYRVRKSEKNFMERMLSIMASLRPRLTMDAFTGEPSIELKIETASGIQSGLETILGLISEIKQDIVFMFDEFQQIAKYPEKNIEQMLRTVIQTYPSVSFIFSGSSKHMLENMFMSPGRPFYQSSELMYLDRIKSDDYNIFIHENFHQARKTIDDGSIDRIFNWTRRHTFYVQYVLNLLFEKVEKTIGNEQVNEVLLKIITEFEPQYISYRNLLPPHQYRLLMAIAVEDGVIQPTSGEFIRKNDLTSPSSVSTSLKALAEKEMIVYELNRWNVYDVFFSRWLEYHYKE
jgi:AAA+ ATPase superfamily predicted ATPase